MECQSNKIDSNITGLAFAEEQCLKQLPTVAPAVPAAGTITCTAVGTDGNTITVNGIAFTMKVTPVGANDVLIGANTTATATNLATKIDTILTGTVDAIASTNVISLTATVAGAAGNAITLAASNPAFVVSGPKLDGGEDATSDPIWYGLEPNTYSDFGGQITTVARSPIDPSRQNKKGTVTDLEASGGFNIDFTQNNLNRLMQGFFFADWRQKPRANNFYYSALPNVAITSATAATKRYGATANLTRFHAGALLKAENFSHPANNGVKTLVSTAAAYVEVAEVLIDEPAAPASANLVPIGALLQSGNASIVVTAGIASLVLAVTTVADFTKMGFIPGEWVFIGGDESGSRFTNNVGFARILSITATTLVFDMTTFAAVSESGVGKNIKLFYGDVIKNENTPNLIKRRSYNFERTLGQGETGTQAEYLEGSVTNELTLNIPQADKLNADLTVVACDNTHRSGEAGDEIKAGIRVASLGEDAFNTSSDIYRIHLSINDPATSNPEALFGYVTEATLGIANGITPNKAVGILGAFDTSAGNFEISGSITAYFSTVAAVRAVRQNADVGLSIIAAAKNGGFLFDIPLLSLGGGRVNVEKDAPITVPLEPAGAENQHGYTLLYQTFGYLPNVAMPQ